MLLEDEERTETRIPQRVTKYEIRRSLIILVISIVVGIIAGLGGVIYILAIEYFEHLFFGLLAHLIGAVVFFVSPTIGGLLLSALTLPHQEIRGDGVPNVIHAVHFKAGDVKAYVGPYKLFVSSITIGSGGSAGREGAIAQIGASFGSALASLAKLDPRERELITVVGVSAGIAAAFGAPLGGMLFGLEVVLLRYTVSEMIPVVIASAISASITVSFLGPERFIAPGEYTFRLVEFPLYVLLSALIGVVATGWVRMYYKIEDFLEERFGPFWRPVVGGAITGGLSMAFYLATGCNPVEYGILGAGVTGTTILIRGATIPLTILLAIIILKMLTTSFTVGSGGAGGVFYPSLLIGAAIGLFYGQLVKLLFPEFVYSPAEYAILGMAGFFAAVAGCPLTMGILVIELTGELDFLGASLVVSFTSYFTAKILMHGHTIYTLKEIGEKALDLKLVRLRDLKSVNVTEVMMVPPIVLRKDEPVWKAIEVMRLKRVRAVPVTDAEGSIVGVVTIEDVLKAHDPNTPVERIMLKAISISANATIYDALMEMNRHKTHCLLIRRNGKILGIIDQESILEGFLLAAEREFIIATPSPLTIGEEGAGQGGEKAESGEK